MVIEMTNFMEQIGPIFLGKYVTSKETFFCFVAVITRMKFHPNLKKTQGGVLRKQTVDIKIPQILTIATDFDV